jgi:hypothetical protein
MPPMKCVLVNILRIVFDSIYLLNFEITQRYRQHKYKNKLFTSLTYNSISLPSAAANFLKVPTFRTLVLPITVLERKLNCALAELHREEKRPFH